MPEINKFPKERARPDIETISELDELSSLVKKAATSSFAEKMDPLTREEISDRETDRELRKNYAIWFVRILISQIVIMNLIFLAVGLKWIQFSDTILGLYMGGTLAEIFGIVSVITKYLFKKT